MLLLRTVYQLLLRSAAAETWARHAAAGPSLVLPKGHCCIAKAWSPAVRALLCTIGSWLLKLMSLLVGDQHCTSTQLTLQVKECCPRTLPCSQILTHELLLCGLLGTVHTFEACVVTGDHEPSILLSAAAGDVVRAP